MFWTVRPFHWLQHEMLWQACVNEEMGVMMAERVRHATRAILKKASWPVIVTDIWQKLSTVEHKKMRIVKTYWQLLSHMWRNLTC
jgi:hypothetical protein